MSNGKENEARNIMLSKKIFIIIGILGIIFLICIGGTLALLFGGKLFNLSGNVWLDEGDPGFEESSEVKDVLNDIYPNKDFTVKYYIKHTDPQLKKSLYVEYVDETYSATDTEKYADKSNNTGEFAQLGSALCEAEVRDDLKYNVITFKVLSSSSYPREFYENSFYCFDAI